MERLEAIRRAFGKLLEGCGVAAGIATFAIMGLVVANALLRYGFGAPIAGTLEITESALPFVIFLSLALTQYQGGHIRVVLLTQHLPPGPARAVRVVVLLAGLGLFAWAAWASFGMAAKSFAIGEMERGAVRFPIWPVKMVVCVGLLLLAIQFLLDALYAALGGSLPDSEPEQVE